MPAVREQVRSPMLPLVLMCVEIVQDLSQTIRYRALHQLDETKAAVEVGAPDVRAQTLRFGKSLRPLGIVHVDLSPRRSKKNRPCVRVRGRAPGIRGAPPAAAQVADQIGYSATEQPSPITPPSP